MRLRCENPRAGPQPAGARDGIEQRKGLGLAVGSDEKLGVGEVAVIPWWSFSLADDVDQVRHLGPLATTQRDPRAGECDLGPGRL